MVNVDPPLRVGPFASFVQHLAPALRGSDFATAFEPFAASIGVGRLPEAERDRPPGTQHVDQQLVLDYWFTLLTQNPDGLQSDIEVLLDRVSVPYLWLLGEPVDSADQDQLLAHVPEPQIETWPNRATTTWPRPIGSPSASPSSSETR